MIDEETKEVDNSESKIIINSIINNEEVALDYLARPNNNENTDLLKEKIKLLDNKNKQILVNNLENIIKDILMKEDKNEKIKELPKDKKFFIMENAIYYIGRSEVTPNIELLKNIYYITDNFYIKQNIAFTLLPFYIEEIELNFVYNILKNEKYQEKLRSWTMAFFYCKENPYNYVDNGKDDWELAKNARINRLKINDEKDSRIEKAKSFRLMDLLVLYLFKKSRGNQILNDREIEIIKNSKIAWKEYSKEKEKLIIELKGKLIV